jgi:hypothetical protein
MNSSIQQKEKKFVPRFRRRNENEYLIDADDQEAQNLIEKDLQSHFKWNTDLHEDLKYQFDHSEYQQENNQQQISLSDQLNEDFIYDIENNNQQLWNINIQENDHQPIQWTHDQEQQFTSFSMENIQDQQQQWSLQENNQLVNQFNLLDQYDHLYKHHLDTIQQNQQIKFIKGEEFRHQVLISFYPSFFYLFLI